MPTFDAGSTVEPLDYDFTTLANWPKEMASAKGPIQEPSDRAIGDFLEGLKGVGKQAVAMGVEEIDSDDPAAVLAAIDNVTGDDYVELMEMMAGLYGTLCSDSPSKTHLMQLPLRVRMKFFSWLMSEVVRPEDVSSGGAQVVSLPQRAAGG